MGRSEYEVLSVDILASGHCQPAMEFLAMTMIWTKLWRYHHDLMKRFRRNF
jgi:hypothetical protein